MVMSRLLRAGLLVGAAGGAMYLARKYRSGELDQTVNKAKSMAKEIGGNFSRQSESSEPMTSSLRGEI
jgi:hypothetical protein